MTHVGHIPTSYSHVISSRQIFTSNPFFSGDNWRTGRAVGRQVGIDSVLADVAPAEKAARVRELQASFVYEGGRGGG